MDLQLGGDGLAEDHELVPRETGQGVPGADQARHATGHGDQELVPDQVSVAVVDDFEAVEVDEEDGHRVPGAHTAQQGVLQVFEEEEAVRQAGERIVQGAAVKLLGRVLQLGPGLRVSQVRHGHVGQSLRRLHVAGAERPRRLPVEVERPELPGVVPEREGEHGGEAGLERPRSERGEGVRGAEVGHGDRLP